MKRRDFILNGCSACLSVSVIAAFLPSCASTKYLSGELGENGLTVSKEEFKIKRDGAFRSFIIIRNDALQYPICVYRFSETEYSALYMRCTHQGTELQASGDMLQCPAHGSEFSNKGEVTNGPADLGLRTFPVTVLNNNELFIDLRKQS